MKNRVSRRNFLLGGATILGANALPGIPGTSLNLIPTASAQITRPDYMIRVNANENPWGPSRVALRAIFNAVDEASLYGSASSEMKAILSEQVGVPTEYIGIGSGSGEMLKVGGLLAGMEGGSIVCADPTFEDLPRYASNMGVNVIRVPVDGNLNTDLEAMASAIQRDTKLVYLCNPNNPIPSIIEKNALRDFVTEVSRDRMVFIDEAYFDFVESPDYETMMDLVRNGGRNIIIARTASKIHGLAGLRVGFAYAHPELIQDISNKQTGQLNIVGMRAANASLRDIEHQDFTRKTNRATLNKFENFLTERGSRFVKSYANFSFVHTGREITELQDEFRQEGILIGRPFPPFRDWARISMPKPDEMDYLTQVYRKILG